MAYIALTSGAQFEYDHIGDNFICIEDIATSLSRINRFLGHGRFPFSVAAHSVNVAAMCEAVKPGCGIHGLLHDAHEAYIGDMATPLKRSRPNVRSEIEYLAKQTDKAIYIAFGLAFPNEYELNIVKAADEWAGLCEGKVLLRNYPDYPTQQLAPNLQSKMNYPTITTAMQSPDSAKITFIRMFQKYAEGAKKLNAA